MHANNHPRIMKSSIIGAFDAKNRFSELLEKASHGEETIVTKHGRPVARIVPFEDNERAADEVLASIAGTRRKIARNGGFLHNGETWKGLAREGLR